MQFQKEMNNELRVEKTTKVRHVKSYKQTKARFIWYIAEGSLISKKNKLLLKKITRHDLRLKHPTDKASSVVMTLTYIQIVQVPPDKRRHSTRIRSRPTPPHSFQIITHESFYCSMENVLSPII